MSVYIYIYIYIDSVRFRVPAEEDTNTFADVGNLLTMSISARLSKDSGSTHLIHTIQSPEHHNNSLQTPYTLELDLDPFSPDVAPSVPSE